MHPKISLIVPCWRRPMGTLQILFDIVNQTISDWEAIMISDGCPIINKLFESAALLEYKSKASKAGSELIFHSLDKHYGGYGYEAINRGIQLARGEFLAFAANDDRIAPNHFANYLYPTKFNDVDLIAFESVVHETEKRTPSLRLGGIGHSEILIRASLAKSLPPHTPEYGHDWSFIESALSATSKAVKDLRGIPTYVVCRLGHEPELE